MGSRELVAKKLCCLILGIQAHCILCNISFCEHCGKSHNIDTDDMYCPKYGLYLRWEDEQDDTNIKLTPYNDDN